MNTSEKSIGHWFIHSELKLISKCHKRRPLLQLVSYGLLHIRIAFYIWAWTKCNFKSSLMIPTFYAIFEKSGGKFVLHFAKRPKNLLDLQILDMRLPITLPSYSLWGIDNILFTRLSKPPSQITPPPSPRRAWNKDINIVSLQYWDYIVVPLVQAPARRKFIENLFLIQLFSFFERLRMSVVTCFRSNVMFQWRCFLFLKVFHSF